MNRLGGSALAQVFNRVGDRCPDVDDPDLLVRFFRAVQDLVGEGLLMAYHDRSDGGLLVTLTEMAIGGRMGMEIDVLAPVHGEPVPWREFVEALEDLGGTR